MVAILVLLTLIVFITLDYFTERRAARRAPVPAGSVAAGLLPSPSAPASPARPEGLPAGVFVTRSHEWIRLLTDGVLRLGAAPLPLQALGTADAVDLPETGTRVRRGEPLVTLHRGDREIVLRAPADGRVSAINRTAARHTRHLDEDPYKSGWLCEITPDTLDFSFLAKAVKDGDAESWLRSELRRLRDFLAAPQVPALESAQVLQDGGLPVHGFGAQLDPETWEALVAAFFDPAEGEAPARTPSA